MLAKMRDGDWRDHSQGANPMASVTHAMLTKRVENAINEGLPSGTANDKAIDSSSALFEDVVGGDTR